MNDDELKGMSIDDLCFEVKRLSQKVQVLENDKLILKEEYEIAQAVKDGKTTNNNENTKLKEELSKCRNTLTTFVTKYKVVKTFLDLERKALADVKIEVEGTTHRLVREMESRMNIFKDTVLARESLLQKRYQKINQELFKAKDMAECYKVELHDVKNDRRVLQKNLDNIEEELTIEKNKLSSQIASITSKIEMYQKEHAKEVKKLNDTMLEKENERKQFEEDLAKWKLTLKLRLDEKLAVDKKLEEMTALLAGEKESNSKILANERENIKNLENTCSQLRDENSMLHCRLKTQEEQQSKLLDAHDALQRDFKSILEREKSLRSELSGNSNDKSEMQRKLRSITEKVSTLESDHSRETGELKALIEQKQQLLDSALESREREGVRAENLGQEVKRLEKVIASDTNNMSGIEEKLRNAVKDKEALEKKLEMSEKEMGNMNNSLDGLRRDRDEALNQSLSFQNEMKILRQKLADNEFKLEKMSKQKNEETSAYSEIDRLKRELEASENKNEQQFSEICGLKDTVRRECEERTELMIEVSDLKDQIKRLTSRNGGPLRSQTSGIDSSVQARQVFKSPESGDVAPGMLRQLTGSLSSNSNLTDPSAVTNPPVQDRDDNWSKQRQTAQQNSGKSKRKSKYRP